MLTRRRFLLALGGAGAAGALGWVLGRRPTAEVRREGRALGTTVSMSAFHSNPDRAERALDAAFAELEHIEAVMSLYRPDSQLCRLNRQGVLVDPDPSLFQVLACAQAFSLATQGAFDVTVQPLWEPYASARREGRLPSPAEVESARARVGWQGLRVSPDRVSLAPGMAVTLNGIAQGYAADRAIAALRAHGVEEALVDTGEEGAFGRPRRVGIQHPRMREAFIDVVRLDGRCLATSGDYETPLSPDRALNHVFDPHTGGSPQHFSSVSVLAPTGIVADALSTALFVLGLDEASTLLAAHGAEALFVGKDGSVKATGGFPHADA